MGSYASRIYKKKIKQNLLHKSNKFGQLYLINRTTKIFIFHPYKYYIIPQKENVNLFVLYSKYQFKYCLKINLCSPKVPQMTVVLYY